MILAVIPARAGSKGLKNKNVRQICGKSLIEWTIQAALEIPFFDLIVVTTDCPKVKEICKSYEKIFVIDRPIRLSGDFIPLLPVIRHALTTCEIMCLEHFDLVFTLQPTSPLRTVRNIHKAYEIFKKNLADVLVSVCEERHSIWRMGNNGPIAVRPINKNRQEIDPYYVGNGAIFINKSTNIIRHTTRIAGKNKVLYPMGFVESIDIHTKEDLELAEFFIKKYKLGVTGFDI